MGPRAVKAQAHAVAHAGPVRGGSRALDASIVAREGPDEGALLQRERPARLGRGVHVAVVLVLALALALGSGSSALRTSVSLLSSFSLTLSNAAVVCGISHHDKVGGRSEGA